MPALQKKKHPKEATRLAEIIPQIMNLVYRLTKGLNCPADFTVPQFKVIQNLHHVRTPIRMTALSDRLGVSQSTVTDTVKRLVKSGFVHRQRSPTDDRVVFLSLTKKSEDLMREHNEGLVKFFIRLCHELPPNDRKSLLKCHEKILRIYQQLDEKDES